MTPVTLAPMTASAALQIDPRDDVAVALAALEADASIAADRAAAEANGEREIALWKRGVSL